MTALSVMGLVPPGGEISGDIRLGGQPLLALSDAAMAGIRGKRIGMIFQEPATALNPVKTIGAQVAEVARLHLGQDQAAARETAAHWLDRVGLPPTQFPLNLYPHQLSGGQKQRVLIAAALAGGPEILIADEPTTALDATIQLQILRLLDELVRDEALSLLIISHDLGVIAAMADDVAVMKDGRIVEHATAAQLFAQPAQAYTKMLLAACPELDSDAAPVPPPQGPVLLEVTDLRCRYRRPKAHVFAPQRYNEAVQGVSFVLKRGQSMGIVGESGSGKTTVAKCIAGLLKPSDGTITYAGQRIDRMSVAARLTARLPVNMIFQDPNGSLNPRHNVLRSITEPLHGRAMAADEKVQAAVRALEKVQLDAAALDRYPHQFSGGQRQRIATARALIAEPELVIADEPVAALDVSIQAQIIELLNELRAGLNLTLLFISHDLAVVRHTTDTTIVMTGGRIVEAGPTAALFSDPAHPYTQNLLQAVLPADPSIARARLGATEIDV